MKSIVFRPKPAISLVDQETNAVTQEGSKMDMQICATGRLFSFWNWESGMPKVVRLFQMVHLRVPFFISNSRFYRFAVYTTPLNEPAWQDVWLNEKRLRSPKWRPSSHYGKQNYCNLRFSVF